MLRKSKGGVLRETYRAFASRLLPETIKRPLRRLMLAERPAVGRVRFGDFGRTDPISRNYGFDRGTPIDRVTRPYGPSGESGAAVSRAQLRRPVRLPFSNPRAAA